MDVAESLPRWNTTQGPCESNRGQAGSSGIAIAMATGGVVYWHVDKLWLAALGTYRAKTPLIFQETGPEEETS